MKIPRMKRRGARLFPFSYVLRTERSVPEQLETLNQKEQ